MIRSCSKKKVFFSLILAGFILTACVQEFETNVTQSRLQVIEERFSDQLPLRLVDDEYVAALAKHYSRVGEGDINLTVTYDPKSRTDTAMKASNRASDIIDMLRKNGVNKASVNVMPVHSEMEPQMMVDFVSYRAEAPKNCTTMPGLYDTNVKYDEEYKLGCSIETVLARQIARPADLKGQGASNTSDGRRAANIVEQYRTGTPNESLEGESASGD